MRFRVVVGKELPVSFELPAQSCSSGLPDVGGDRLRDTCCELHVAVLGLIGNGAADGSLRSMMPAPTEQLKLVEKLLEKSGLSPLAELSLNKLLPKVKEAGNKQLADFIKATLNRQNRNEAHERFNSYSQSKFL
ncbi:MAG: hypothetical protein K2Z81_18780 [Cyanobacteria bacterium]|nr:hypothetical protein [Cyanobacteriota bacterium]